MRISLLNRPVVAAGLSLLASLATAAELTDPNTIVEQANLASYYAGQDGRSDVRMLIVDSQGREQRRQFTIVRKNLEAGGDQSFLVVFSRPSDVRGTVYLVKKHIDRDDDRWLYLPGLDLIKRISAGDKRTSFVGADYFYEDVSGRNPAEDTHDLIETTDQYYVLKHVPRDASSVEFASYVTWVDRSTLLPMKIEYTNAGGKVYRRIEVQQVETVQGYPTVARSRVSNLETGGYTDMQFGFVAYDIGVPEDVFTERSLRNPPKQWLQRPES